MNCTHPEPLGRLIYLTAQKVKNLAEKLLQPYGLTLEQFHLLKHMSTESGISQRELGGLVDKTPANVTRILDRLEQKSLVDRRKSPGDRRAIHVFLTGQGAELVREVFAIFKAFSAQLTSGVSETEQEQTRSVLNRIGRNINELLKD